MAGAVQYGRLQDRIALVTGASRGIGRAVALRFAQEGAHVIAVARTQGGLEELDDEIQMVGGTATLVPADLGDHPKIDHIGAAIFERFGRLDVLVGNAAILGILSPVGHVDPGTWDQVMRVNVTANWRLIRSFDPLLRMSESGRAIFVTSGAASHPTAYWGPYATSKAALEMMVLTYAAEVKKTPLAGQSGRSRDRPHRHAGRGLPRRGSGEAQGPRGSHRSLRRPGRFRLPPPRRDRPRLLTALRPQSRHFCQFPCAPVGIFLRPDAQANAIC